MMESIHWFIVAGCFLFVVLALGYGIRPVVDDWREGRASARDVGVHFLGLTLFCSPFILMTALVYKLYTAVFFPL